MSRCEYCPAGWEDRSYEGECNSFGCRIYGVEIVKDDCKLSKAEVEKRLQQLEDYEAGKIERPQWVANKFMRELDNSRAWLGHLGLFLPGYPPPRMKNGCHENIYSSMNMKDNVEWAYKHGYQDAKDGKEPELE